jgi:hypothetical protein
MSSYLHTYIGPYVLTGPDSLGGPKRNEFDRLHQDQLTDQSLGYDGQGYAWIPNVRHAPGLHFISRHSELKESEITSRLIDELKQWFATTYAAEISTLCKLWPDAQVRYGVVAYYL